ncbi:pyrimidine reductase family protein [Arthrobacter citreus]|uniref:pyrimidine reductase family protein n=1 Tax=Arthrobacter TaxID=1663 RepID=UPI00126431B1|nr:pyrimidine reductase family protein [Arthrobacter gandavensis]
MTAPVAAAITAAGCGAELSDDELLDAYAWDFPCLRGEGPRFRFNFVASVDGAAALDGRSGGLGDGADNRVFALLRQTADVILVGAGTVRAEGYSGELLAPSRQSWRVGQDRTAHPALAIVSGSLDLDPDSALFREAPVRPLLLTAATAPEERRAALERVADVVVAGERTVEPEQAARALADRGFHRVLCEGGPQLFGSFQAAGLVDELCLTVSPLLTAGTATRITAGTRELAPHRLSLVQVLRGGDTLLLRYGRAGMSGSSQPSTS